MGQVTLRPELKNAGGEMVDILYKGKLVGSMTLLYREGDRLVGSVQLDKSSMEHKARDKAMKVIHDYVQAMIDALAVPFCQVIVTHSRYDHVIATEDHVGNVQGFMADDASLEEVTELEFGRYESKKNRSKQERGHKDKKDKKKNKAPAAEDLLLEEDVTDMVRPLELVIVGEDRNRIEYHVYDAEQHLIAEALMRLKQDDVLGEVTWYLAPTTDEIDEVTEMLVTDFDPEEVDTFNIAMYFEDEEVAHIELTHEDFYDDDTDEVIVNVEGDFDIRLIRDDGGTLTYEIYSDDRDHERLGTATMDISSRQVSGYIDFIQPGNKEEREMVATTLMRELDKERDYDTFNVTMLYQEELIDEIAFDMKEVH
jgi:hypothetical protein